MARRLGELKEDAAYLFRQSAFGAGEPLRKQREIRLVAAMQIGRNQIVLALEVVIERPLGDAGFFRHGVHADAPDAFTVEQLARRRDDALTCGRFHAGSDVY